MNALPPVYKLRDLEASFVKITKIKNGHVQTYKEIGDKIKGADGIRYKCPVCRWVNGGLVGTESCLHWFTSAKISAAATPGPGRWNPSGTSIDDLTFVAPNAYSVHMVGHWHGFIENGTVRVDAVSSKYKKVPQPKKKKSVKKPSKSKRR